MYKELDLILHSATPPEFIPLGMEDGRIKDSQLSSSDNYNADYSAKAARLNNKRAWISGKNG